jgi:hypothetical protein
MSVVVVVVVVVVVWCRLFPVIIFMRMVWKIPMTETRGHQ